jgi:hypothetical protein
MRPAPRPRRARVDASATVRRAERPIPIDDWEARVSLFGEVEL